MLKKGFVGIYILIVVLVIGIALFIYFSLIKSSGGLTSLMPSIKNEPLPSPSGSATIPSGKKFVGIMGSYVEDFATIKSWGGNTAHVYKNPGSTIEIGSALQSAKANGLYFMASVAKINQFNDAFDLTSFNSNTSKFLPDLDVVAGDPYFLGYWLIDEPCNSKKRSQVQAEDFDDLYKAVKAVNPQVPIVINFGTLECLQGFTSSSKPGLKFTDIGMFTVTEKKLMQRPSYIAEQAALTKGIKTYDPSIKILPQVEAVGLIQKGAPIPSASWIESAGLSTAKHLDVFDGMLFYSFHAFDNVNFIGDSISNVVNDPAYVSAFKTVFSAALK